MGLVGLVGFVGAGAPVPFPDSVPTQTCMVSVAASLISSRTQRTYVVAVPHIGTVRSNSGIKFDESSRINPSLVRQNVASGVIIHISPVIAIAGLTVLHRSSYKIR